MGLILDSTILIAYERRGLSVVQLAQNAEAIGETNLGLSTVSAVELTHGIFRARSESDKQRRNLFAQSVFNTLVIHSVTLDIARLAGQIEGEQAALGIGIPFQDLIIGATALHLGFAVATAIIKHFQLIPGLRLISL